MKWAWCVLFLACGSPHARPDAMADATVDPPADATADGHPLGPPPMCPDGSPAIVLEDFGGSGAGSGSCGNLGSFGVTDMGSATSGGHSLTLTAQPYPGNTHGCTAACAWSIAASHGVIASGSTSPTSAVSIGVRTNLEATATNTQNVTTLSDQNRVITQHPLTDLWRRFGPSATADTIEVDESFDGQTWSLLGNVTWMGGWPSSVELDFKLVTGAGDTAIFGPIYTCP